VDARGFARSRLVAHLRPGGDLAMYRPMAALSLLSAGSLLLCVFGVHSLQMAVRMSEPVIITRLKAADGAVVTADDYREVRTHATRGEGARGGRACGSRGMRLWARRGQAPGQAAADSRCRRHPELPTHR
jgi:hypothetical protein